MLSHNPPDPDPIAEGRSAFRKKLITELLIGVIVALVVGVVDFLGYQNTSVGPYLRNINTWTLLVAAITAPAWIANLISAWQEVPLKAVISVFRQLAARFPALGSFVYGRALLRLRQLEGDLTDLTGRAGQEWTGNSRLDTASNLFDSCEEITEYWATSTDPPCEHNVADVRFLARQRTKLRNADVRRLLVYPLDRLLNNLGTSDYRANLKSYLGMHHAGGFKLRYWPHSARELSEVIGQHLPTELATDPLADFGIIDKRTVFGQRLAATDEDRPTGPGHIYTDSVYIQKYCEAFDSLWNLLRRECQPASQLDALVRAAENREALQQCSLTGTGVAYFDTLLECIKNSRGLFAIDVASDMSSWWTQDAYLKFLHASIDAATQFPNETYARIFVFARPLEDRTAAVLFRQQVALPQVTAGIRLKFLTSTVLVDQDLAAMDCICGVNDWGFQLLPDERFQTDSVTEKKNAIHPNFLGAYREIFRHLDEAKDQHVYDCRSQDDCGEAFVDWLCYAAHAD